MKNQLLHAIVTSALILGLSSGVHAADLDTTRIKTALRSYEDALNASDVDGVLKLFMAHQESTAFVTTACLPRMRRCANQ